ncbi:hypothetical protein A7K93_05245 [Candidatus Methylacidiphilum fumarolicum]|uniref:Uncharacterized protein n=2 Tax=Candidatus Methylacidiphilum fumarolicum TaxID=591154 RepID=I0JWJ5_METFB|nr:hypothetical protein [Candidatus Methylacidiphilum fumarolicum]MBW6415336.1 hypothetical protein [Candidatus Methylacidiphilum fumarolicum]TFE68665.1 hypothetical protein A7K73_07385 [Candidatus Methylacidiphilum fumarolicum]TFE72574.1 hypothetical protein A7K72_08370 [Candidatus Methylacidiphilum fumarolicum]TFE73891.1 hypothetical protein A7K93_05245 [Candidatus Methylacidiphilum fumarolicum]TFE77513.1 hypothetical protein A7D33_04480 [Candidatus Methylacidiphilum fumarolicum]
MERATLGGYSSNSGRDYLCLHLDQMCFGVFKAFKPFNTNRCQWPAEAANVTLCRPVLLRVQRNAGVAEGASQVRRGKAQLSRSDTPNSLMKETMQSGRQQKGPTEATQKWLNAQPERRWNLRPSGRGGCQEELYTIEESFIVSEFDFFY